MRALMPESSHGCRLVRADVVVGVLPVEEVGSEAGDGGRGLGAVVELLPVGTVGAFDAAVELGTARRETKEQDALLLAGVFELAHELGAAIHLDRFDDEGSASNQVVGVNGWRAWR